MPAPQPVASPNRVELPRANGQPGHEPVNGPNSYRLHKPRGWLRVRNLLAFAGVGLALLGVWSARTSWVSALFGKAPFAGPTWTVPREKLRVAIVERGTIESARNGDITCTVRSGTRGSTVATTIKWVIDPGVQVVKGDKLIELDSSGFVEQLKDQKIKVDQAKANWVTADEQYHIQESQNESDVEAAKNALDLARIDLHKYEKGEFLKELDEIEGRRQIARSDLEAWQERATWSSRLSKLGYINRTQGDADLSRLESARIALRKVEKERSVLVEFTKPRTVQDLSAKLAESKRALDRVRSHARAKLAQAEADRLAKDSVFKQEQARKQEIEAEIAKCLIVAPQDGMVVYYVSEQARGGGGSQQAIVAQGEPVREGQKLMQIPDLTQMVVNVRVHEAMVSALRNEKSSRDVSTWQSAQIRIDAMPNRPLKGHVKTVDTVAGQQDWFAADVKLYKTVVSIDEPVEGLKPGMSAEVTIYADESPGEVLLVPVQAIVGTISLGAKPRCFVVGADGQPELRDIVVGMSNQRLVEVKSGINEGDKVILDPAPLMADSGG